MRDFLEQIQGSLESRYYYLSLMAALTVPDIAGAMDAEDGLANGARYAAWYDRYARPQFSRLMAARTAGRGMAHPDLQNPLSGEACYRFRCSMLHQGTTQHTKGPYSRIIFVEPGATSNVFHYNTLNDALNIDLPSFCREIVAAGYEWLAAVEQTELYLRNSSRFARRHPTGLAPFIVGIPVVG